ncbi:mRNA 3'-end-processing protein RNA14 [Mycena sanguinolenta]|uniref:mRNA 3'-end-processing protein RNA14 n=1 Tax=Mycena sanguinolenta TaxID=230812 RepID=A0A8H6Y7J7_9AGAR|nr:mRNA 3'-end-processing protein RNA14 [Mycena sanguinolenta]
MSETLPDPSVKTEAGSDPIPPPSDYDALMARLKESPHDPESWKRLIDVAESSGDIPRIREAYDALLKQTSPAVELWKFYLDYVRRVNNGPATRDIVRKAYDFALNHVGQDRDSGPIWAEYIQFLNAGESSNTWETQQKMDALRKVYHRAVQTPLENVEQLWTQLEAFEMGLNKITAKKFMSELSPAHMQARTVLRQLNNHLQGLGNNNTNGIFLPAPATFSAQERELIKRWKLYLKWEEGNPLEIEEKDRATFISRVEKVYRKAVIRMRYYPEIWFMAYSWTASVGKNDDALSILKAGLEANPESFALTYAYAEQLEKAELKRTSGISRPVLRANLARLTALAAPPEASAEETKEENGSQESISTAPATNKHYQDELAERKKLYSNAWINYMRFARRAQGQTTCRETFSKARKDEYVGWEVYEAAAMTEYRCNLDDGRLVASRIFENGMKKFGTDVAYVLAHLSFLLTINDENNARALFERVVPTFTPAEAKPIWERWSRSQYQYDDLEAVLELERRMAEVYPNGTFDALSLFCIVVVYERLLNATSSSSLTIVLSTPPSLHSSTSLSSAQYPHCAPLSFSTFKARTFRCASFNTPPHAILMLDSSDAPIKRFAQRHTYHSIDAIADNDLGFAKTRKLGSINSSGINLTPSIPPPGGVSPLVAANANTNGNTHVNDAGNTTTQNPNKRPPPPGDRKPNEYKRPRPDDRDRRRYSPPPPPPRRDPPPRDKDDKPVSLPAVLSWFVTQLPPRETFDGPIFNTDNLMETLRTAVIPSSSNRSRSPPPPPRSAGRPPPDYGPYQGPQSGPPRGGRRY